MRVESRPLLADELTARDISRFWRFVDKSGDCWIWTGSRAKGDYGSYFFQPEPRKTRRVSAHRTAYAIEHGEAPGGDRCVLHRCDNPPCVNPAHLFLGTHDDNMDDMTAKGRRPAGEAHYWCRHPEAILRGERHYMRRDPSKAARLRGEGNPQAKLTAGQIVEIRARVAAGAVQRRLAAEYGVSPATVCLVVSGKHWPHVA